MKDGAVELGDGTLIALDGIARWQDAYGPRSPHPTLDVSAERSGSVLNDLIGRLHDNYPFFHPRYAGQMLKPPHPIAVSAYVAAMLINPNKHALDGGPATARLENEVVADVARCSATSSSSAT